MTATAGNPGTPRWRAAGTAGAALVGVAAGGVLWAVGEPAAADTLWASTTALLLIPLTWSVVRSLARRDFGVDVIALLSMAGALAVGQYLAGAVVAVMLAGGNTLEAYAQQRARRELSLLVSRIPTTANLRRGDEIVTVPVAAVAVADSMLIRGGEIVPADGTLMSQDAVIDTAALTGEPLPVHLRRGEDVASGSVNAGAAIEIAATRPADESTYAALVRLVRAAERSQAPFVRMADRYAAWFLPITLALAALGWAVSGDPVRAVAVLVIATPCPLILAAPVALVSGVSRAARAGVIVKGAAVIEQLGAVDTVMLDKTGTLTLGVPMVERVEPSGPIGESELLSLAASVDQASAHVMAKALVEKARSDGLDIVFPGHLFETPGQGIRGEVEGRPVAVGSRTFLGDQNVDVTEAPADLVPGAARVMVAVDGVLAGSIVLSDRLRPDAADLARRLHDAGVTEVMLVTGDQRSVAEAVAAAAGIDTVYAEMSAQAKTDVVGALRARDPERRILMVGDGVNDAPALALADVGIAVGATTATVASQTADAVVANDRIERVVDAVRIGRRAMRIARQSVVAGLALSCLGMILAVIGLLPPLAGAIGQEAIDVAVILNALRALRQ